jgi:GAF domain-containing protein/HAMP domain-containing protein
MLKDRYSILSKTEQRIFWITFLLGLVLAAFSATLVDTRIAAPDIRAGLVNAVPFFLAALSFLSTVFIFFGRGQQGSWLLLLGLFATLIIAVTQTAGYGFLSAFVLLAVTLFVPLPMLKGQTAVVALAVGTSGAIAILLVDTFWSLPRLTIMAQHGIVVRLATVILGIIILASVTAQYRGFSIRAKLLLLAVGTGLIAILLVAGSATYFTQQALTRATKDALVSAAQQTMDQVDLYVKNSTNQMISDARIPGVIEYLKASPAEQEASEEQILALLRALAQRDPVNIRSYALLDKNGIDLVDTRKQDIGLNSSDRDYFMIPLTKGTNYISPVSFSATSADYGFYMSTPVFEKGTVLGVLRVQIRSSLLDQILVSNSGFGGEGSYGVMLDEHNIVLANGTNPDWVSHTLVKPDETTLKQLVSENRVNPIAADALSLEMPSFAEGLQNFAGNQSFFSSSDAAWGTPVEIGIAKSNNTKWTIAYVQPQSIAFQAVVQQKQIITVVALLTGILIAIAAFVVAGTITRPISRLASTAEQIAMGDLSARAQVTTGDEISSLAVAFNRMTDRLQETLAGLERRVSERTTDLEAARAQSERRAQELQSISDISSLISSEQRLDILLTLITRLVSEKFDFYHVGIFFVDPTRQYVVLRAANSVEGQRMLERAHRLEVGQTGIVGNVAKTGEPRIAHEVGTDAVYFDNPDLPKTRSEMALPLNVHGETIGVLDIQSTQPDVFTENETKTLSILADQIAIAIANARLFGKNKQALDELQSLYNQYLGQEWKTFIRNRPTVGYVQSVVSGRLLEVPVDSQEIREALEEGRVVVLGANGNSLPAIAVPVKLRGQTIGVLRIQAPTKNRVWSQDEINFAQAISDRLALALDNARLLFVSQRQTAKEQKIGEVTAKIGASINMRNVLQTAVEELGRALPGSEVLIQFQSNGKHD